MDEATYLQQIRQVNAQGKYRPQWDSLCRHEMPQWYRESRLGIFLHWGVYSVPAYYNEWYPRLMQFPFTPVYKHHVKTYGKDYPYRKFIEQFRAEKFDAAQWVQTFRDMGADFLMPVGEHHDGFKMYDSALGQYNSVQMGPKRDILGELRAQCAETGMHFATSSHRAERYFYYNGARAQKEDNEIRSDRYSDFYGPAYCPADSAKALWYDDTKIVPTQQWLESWLVHSCELIDRYRPETIFFDWWVSNKAFKPYMREFLAYYYNRAEEWGVQVCVQSKFDSVVFGQGVFDRERGQLAQVVPYVWQSETSTSFSSWGYVRGSKFKSAAQLVCNFVDVVSKNGVFVLNFGPMADGTFCEQEREIIRDMGAWIQMHKDILWHARPYRFAIEGKQHRSGSFVERISYRADDYRFMSLDDKIYIFAMAQDRRNRYRIRSMPADRNAFNHDVVAARVVGSDVGVTCVQKREYLEITLDRRVDCADMPICIELQVV